MIQRELLVFSSEEEIQFIHQVQDRFIDLVNFGTTNLMQIHSYSNTGSGINILRVKRPGNIQQWISRKFRWRPYQSDRSAYRMTLNFEPWFELWLSHRLSELSGNYDTSHRHVDSLTGNAVFQKRARHVQNN